MEANDKSSSFADINSLGAKRAKQAAFALVALRPIRQAIGAVALLVLVRNFDDSTFGAYQIYNSILGFLAVGASFGIANTLARFLPEYFNRKNFSLANRIVKIARRMRLATNLVVLAIIWRVTNILIADLAAFAVLFAGLRWHYSKRVRVVGGPTEFSKAESRRMIRYGFFYNFNDMGHFTVGTRIGTFFIASIIDVTSVGAYALGNKILDIVRDIMPLKFFFDVIRPLFFTLDPVADGERVKHYFQLLVKFSYMFMVPVTALVIVVNQEIFDVVFGGKFLKFSPLLAWLFFLACLTAFGKPLTLVVQLREKAAIVLLSKFFGVINILGLLVLVPTYGVYGAALATGFAEVCRQVFQWWFVREHASFDKMGRFFLLTISYWAAFYALGNWLQTYIESAFWRLALAMMFAAAWWLLYVRLPLFNENEITTIREAAGPRPRKLLGSLGII
jgi:O-antigen/teichoic acid export membrane protein